MTAAAKDHLGSNVEFFLLISAGDMMQDAFGRAGFGGCGLVHDAVLGHGKKYSVSSGCRRKAMALEVQVRTEVVFVNRR
jgi:hypothetical protein